MVKKFILLTFLIISSFTFVYAAPSNIVQKFSTDLTVWPGTCTIVYNFTEFNGLGIYNVGHGTQFYNYQLNFNDTLSLNKAYHVKMTYYGTISDGFYVTPMEDVSYYHVYQGTNTSPIPIYNLTFNVESTYYRSIEFDFLNTDLNNSYSIQMHNCGQPVLYYSYSGNSQFGFTGLTIEQLDQEDFNSLIVQNDIIITQNQQTNQNLTNIDNSINDETPVSNSDLNDSIDDWNDSLSNENALSDFILMPFTILNNISSGLSARCETFSLGSLFNHNIVLPCINIQDYLGSNLWSTIDSLFCLYMIYNIAMLFIQCFEGITTLRDDFDSLYTPQHGDFGYRPRHGGD